MEMVGEEGIFFRVLGFNIWSRGVCNEVFSNFHRGLAVEYYIG
jgi:hypothetical protein